MPRMVQLSGMPTSPLERRYVRDPEPAPVRITPRVVSILYALHRFSLLTSLQIARLDGGSQQKVVRLLKLLHDHRLVDRVGAPQLHPLSPMFDQRPLAYALSRKGAKVLAESGIDVNTRLDRTTRNKRLVQIAHTISVAECVFALQAAASQQSLAFIDQHDLYPHFPSATRMRRRPLQLGASVHPADFPSLRRILKAQVNIAIEPDRLFGLMQRDQSGWTFALEADQATERVMPKSLSGSSILRKLLGYTALWRESAFEAAWGPSFRAFRCLFVTSAGEKRIQSMIEAQQQLVNAPAGLFLYTTSGLLTTHGPLAPIWRNAERERVPLLER